MNIPKQYSNSFHMPVMVQIPVAYLHSQQQNMANAHAFSQGNNSSNSPQIKQTIEIAQNSHNYDPSCVILEFPSQNQLEDQLETSTSKSHKKAARKLNEKQAQEKIKLCSDDILSATSLGNRVSLSVQKQKPNNSNDHNESAHIPESVMFKRETRSKTQGTQPNQKNLRLQNKNNGEDLKNKENSKDTKVPKGRQNVTNKKKSSNQSGHSQVIQLHNKQSLVKEIKSLEQQDNKNDLIHDQSDQTECNDTTQMHSTRGRNQRERKNNTFYTNQDFISSEEMYAQKKRKTNKLDITTSISKRQHTTASYSGKTIEHLSFLEITAHKSLFERHSITRHRKQFLGSTCKEELTISEKRASAHSFSLNLQGKQKKKSIFERGAFFKEQPCDKLIQDLFEEDTIFLVDNNNHNIEIKVKRTPLDKSANSARKGESDPLEKIVNRFDAKSRHKYFSQIHFIKDYKSGYAPIEIQKQQEKELDEMEYPAEDTHKQHFIRRKQAQNISLKRSCGVSYVKQPESRQENVSEIYEKLPQLVFQCSNGQPKLVEHEALYQSVYHRLFTSGSPWLLCTYFQSDDESLMRDYLLYPQKRWELCKGKYFILRSVSDIWPLFIEKYFLCIHLFFDQKELIKAPHLRDFSIQEVQHIVKHSNIHLGLLFKKSINGKKSFKKSLGDAFLKETPKEEQSKGAPSSEQQASAVNSKTAISKLFREIRRKLKTPNTQDIEVFEKKIEDLRQWMISLNNSEEDAQVISSLGQKNTCSDDQVTQEARVEALQQTIESIQKIVNSKGFVGFQQSKSGEQTENKENGEQSNIVKDTGMADKSEGMELENNNNLKSNDATDKVTACLCGEGKMADEIEEEKTFTVNGHNRTEDDHIVQPSPEKMDLENENEDNRRKNSTGSSNVSSRKPSALMQIEAIAGGILEADQNAVGFSERIQMESNLREGDQNSQSLEKTMTKDTETFQGKNNEGTAGHEESTILLNKIDCEEQKESLICKEIFDYIDRDTSSKNINTLSAKLELYVEEKGWKNSTQKVKSLLSTFILYAKDEFEKLALEMMNMRFAVVREGSEKRITEALQNIRFIQNASSKRKQNFENFVNKKWDFSESALSKVSNTTNTLEHAKQTVESRLGQEKLFMETEVATMSKLLDKEENYSVLTRGDMQMPLYYIATRDSFAFDLIEKISTCNWHGKTFTKTEFFFDPDNHPTNYTSFISAFPDFRVGATLYSGFFSHKELLDIEDSCYHTEVKSFQRHYFPMTAQMTCTASKIRRTKFFFGSRYIWTRQQLSEPHSFVGAGVRQDVSEPPLWMRKKVVRPLEQAGILPMGYINSLALNVYHDGKEGLAQHFDDATRFRQPIFTFKLFSDARLSFGSQLYGFCNSAFVIPMPRGSVLKMEENSYAANGIKHCVRPCDMAGKNATIIMRQMHHKVVNEAILYDEQVDLPTWISTLSSKESAISYGDQKRIEADFLMKSNIGSSSCS